MNIKVQIDSSTLCRRLQQEELERVGDDHVIVEYINMSSLTAAAVVEFITTDLFASVDAALDRTMAHELRLVGDTTLVTDLASLCLRSHRAREMLGVPTLCQREPGPQDTSTDPDDDRREPTTPFHTLTIVQWSQTARERSTTSHGSPPAAPATSSSGSARPASSRFGARPGPTRGGWCSSIR